VSDDVLTASQQADLDDIAAVLADAAIWQMPSAGFDDDIVASVVSAAGKPSTRPVTTGRPNAGQRVVLRTMSIAAAAAIVGVVSTLLLADRSTGGSQASVAADVTAQMVGTELAPGIAGVVDITSESSGLRIEIRLPGLARRDGETFYQVWLKDCAGDKLVPAGSFHELDQATGWAGVAVQNFALVTVTRESVAAPKSADQGTSGEVVAIAPLADCPPTS
jgi:hypothetical protein